MAKRSVLDTAMDAEAALDFLRIDVKRRSMLLAELQTENDSLKRRVSELERVCAGHQDNELMLLRRVAMLEVALREVSGKQPLAGCRAR